VQPSIDLGVEHAWWSAQCFILFLVLGDLLESGSCHSDTLGKIEKYKLAAKIAAANVKNYKIVTTS